MLLLFLSVNWYKRLRESDEVRRYCYLLLWQYPVSYTHLILRSLDAIEGVVREADGQWFYVDQCIDAFLIRTVVNGGQEYTAERMFCYEW